MNSCLKIRKYSFCCVLSNYLITYSRYDKIILFADTPRNSVVSFRFEACTAVKSVAGFCLRHFTHLYNTGEMNFPWEEQEGEPPIPQVRHHHSKHLRDSGKYRVHTPSPSREILGRGSGKCRAQTSSSTATTTQPKSPHHRKRSAASHRTCRNASCYDVTRTNSNYCVDCETVLQSQPIATRNIEPKVELRCAGCERRALSVNNGVCNSCYKALMTNVYLKALPSGVDSIRIHDT